MHILLAFIKNNPFVELLDEIQNKINTRNRCSHQTIKLASAYSNFSLAVKFLVILDSTYLMVLFYMPLDY